MSDKKQIPFQLIPPFRGICIDDTKRPVEIPIEKWPKAGQQYTIIKVVPITHNSTLGFVIKELPLGNETFPYFYHAAYRFGIEIPEQCPEQEATTAVNDLLKEIL